MAISLKNLHRARATLPPRVLIYGPPGLGKEQPLTAKILTPAGWKTMGEMQVGMTICGSDGKTYQVVGVFPQGVKPAYKVTFTDGTSTECGHDHLWKVAGHHFARDGWLIRSLADLLQCDYRQFRVPIGEAFEFCPPPSLPIHPYILGVLIGDGYLAGSTIAFSVPPTKEQIKQNVFAVIGDTYQLTGPSGSASSPQWHISGGDRGKTMKAAISALQLDVSSKDRFIPCLYQTASIADRLELLRGLMDTDGSCKDGRTTFHTCSEQLALDVADLVRSLGGVAIIREYDRIRENKPMEWQVNVRLGVCPFSLEYKAAKWRPAALAFGKHFKSIEMIGNVEQQCISVTAPDHLYVTDGYNLTHNTTLASEWPEPVFLQVEDGTPGDLELTSFGRLTTLDEVMESLAALYTEEHEGKTVVIDSLDKLEPLVWAKVCADNNWQNIEAPGYGKGYVSADPYWRDLLDGANALRRDKGMGIVYIAHSSIETVNDPMTATYSRFDIRLHKRAVGIFQDEVDAILFLNQDVSLKQDDPKAKHGAGTRVRADGGGNRFIYASPRPFFVAKNRYGLPDKMMYERGKGYATLAPHFPGNTPAVQAQAA